jgi:serine/threonine-protein kinase
VGRAATNDVLLHGDGVSREHATLEFSRGTWLLKDVGRGGRTLIHGSQCPRAGRALRDGDLIKIGRLNCLRFVSGIPVDLSKPFTLAAPPVLAGRYEVASELGAGGMARVFLCRDLHLGRDVALKVLAPRAPVKPSTYQVLVEQFQKEARVSSRFAHPNLITIFDIGLTPFHGEERPYYTMRVADASLQDIVTGARPEFAMGDVGSVERVRFAVNVVSRACLGLEHAHRNGVIHLDLKPDNVMLTSFGEVFVADWGLAKLLQLPENYVRFHSLYLSAQTDDDDDDDDDETGEVPGLSVFEPHEEAGLFGRGGMTAGTPGYMPPEQIEARIEALDPRCDVFAAGAVFHFALLGTPAFPGQSVAEVCARTLSGNFDRDGLAAAYPAVVVSLVERALRPAPGDRFASVRDLRAALSTTKHAVRAGGRSRAERRR